MELAIGQTVQAELGQYSMKVRQKLGEGGQGEVYLVEGPNGRMVLKWYYAHQATEEQRAAIRDLVKIWPPLRGSPEAGRRFVWPSDLATVPDSKQFGYLMMEIDKKRFAELGEVQGRQKPQPTPKIMCEIGYQLSNSYRALHLAGYCYRDISMGNMVFDPQTGDVLICDNDNVGVNNAAQSAMLGTWDFMAPEVILGNAPPSTSSDQHSLAVLLFHLWMWHHPMHGDLECAIRSWDIPAKKRIYGEKPVFIFHPTDKTNNPNDPSYGTVRKRWDFCPPTLKALFIHAFTIGVQDPKRRVTEGEWQSVFLQLLEGALPCPSCRAENLWDAMRVDLTCWHCRQSIPVPGRLVVKTAATDFHMLLTPGLKIKAFHLDPITGRKDQTAVLGELVSNPLNPAQWGIRNLTASPWTLAFANGTTIPIPPQRAGPLTAGAHIRIDGCEIQIRS